MPAVETLPVNVDIDGVARITGTTTTVVEVVLDQTGLGLSREQMHEEHPHLSLSQIQGALTYYDAHNVEVDREIACRRQRVEQLEKESTQPITQHQFEERAQRRRDVPWHKKALTVLAVALLSGPQWYQFTGAPGVRSPLVLGVAVAHAVPAATPLPPVNLRQYSVSATAYVPVDGLLRERTMPRAVQEAQSRAYGDRTPLLNEIIHLAPRYFPPGARVLTVKQVGATSDYFRINLNRGFVNARFWHRLGRRSSVLALHALARNIAFSNEPKGNPLPVQFLIEGRRVATIGAFDARRLLRPDKIIRASWTQSNLLRR